MNITPSLNLCTQITKIEFQLPARAYASQVVDIRLRESLLQDNA